MIKKAIYLDNNATTKLDPLVYQELQRIYSLGPVNPSSVHHQGQLARNELTKARRKIAQSLDIPPTQLFFTSGATEAINIALHSLAKKKTKPKIISTRAEHSCIYETLLKLQAKGAELHFLPLNQQGHIDFNELENKLPADGAIFSYANSETGVRLDLPAISNLLAAYNTPLLLDGVAWMGKEKVELPKGTAFVCFSGHKFHAPQGVGFAVFSPQLPLEPLFTGGGQEYNLRSGTPNLANIVALAKAVEIAQEKSERHRAHMQQLQSHFEQGLTFLPHTVHGQNRICNTSCVYFHGVDGEGLFMNLDIKGVMTSIGSACSSGSLEPSRALLAMGLGAIEAKNSLRFSFSRFNTVEEIDEALVILKGCLTSR